MDTGTTHPRHGSSAEAPGFHHHYEEVNGTNIHAVVGGAGPAVMLVHGWPFTWRVWRPLLAPLASAGYTVIALRCARPACTWSTTNVPERTEVVPERRAAGPWRRGSSDHHREVRDEDATDFVAM